MSMSMTVSFSSFPSSRMCHAAISLNASKSHFCFLYFTAFSISPHANIRSANIFVKPYPAAENISTHIIAKIWKLNTELSITVTIANVTIYISIAMGHAILKKASINATTTKKKNTNNPGPPKACSNALTEGPDMTLPVPAACTLGSIKRSRNSSPNTANLVLKCLFIFFSISTCEYIHDRPGGYDYSRELHQ